MRRSFFDIYPLTIGAAKYTARSIGILFAIGRAKSDAKTRMPTPRLRSVHGLTVAAPSLPSLTGKAADEIGGALRKSASAQAGGRKPGFDSRVFFTLGRLHGYSLLAVLRRAVEGVPKAIERKNVRGMGTFCRFSL